MKPSFVVTLVALSALGGGVAACTGSTPGREPPPQVEGGDPQRGSGLIQHYGCGACHIIPGVRGADGLVGPPLIHWARRGYIAGELENNGDNLVRWVEGPQEVETGTDVPDLNVTEQEARDIAAYLYTID